MKKESSMSKKGISRITQRKGEGGRVGQGGKMTAKGKANFKRSGGTKTPCKA